jgi:hypothetical protein
MMLPDKDRAQVDRSKIIDYLLSLSHPDGGGKAAFFMLFGFRIEQWEVLAEALQLLGCSNPVTGVESWHPRTGRVASSKNINEMWDALHCRRPATISGRACTDGQNGLDRRI